MRPSLVANPLADHMQKALSLFEKGPLALVAGEGFEPSTSGLEPYDARLRRLAWSLVAALTSVNERGASTPNLGVSPVAPYPAASRAQIRAQIWLLTNGITVLRIASVSECRFFRLG